MILLTHLPSPVTYASFGQTRPGSGYEAMIRNQANTHITRPGRQDKEDSQNTKKKQRAIS